MARKRKKGTPTPRRKSERKKLRTAKGDYYHQNFTECELGVESCTTPDHDPVSAAVEKANAQ